tara:strand:+ start:64096 stop:64554 length:459 start_codon:yes stop_codon:yes gene_type:complete
MTILEISKYVMSLDHGISENTNWGERGLFYNPGNKLPKGVYLMTFKEKDGPNDNASAIDRGGLFRLNLGISKASFLDLFGEIPERPRAGEIVNTGHNFKEINSIMPHPVYGWMCWIAILNPGKENFERLKPYIQDSLESARIKFRQRIKEKI